MRTNIQQMAMFGTKVAVDLLIPTEENLTHNCPNCSSFGVFVFLVSTIIRWIQTCWLPAQASVTEVPSFPWCTTWKSSCWTNLNQSESKSELFQAFGGFFSHSTIFLLITSKWVRCTYLVLPQGLSQAGQGVPSDHLHHEHEHDCRMIKTVTRWSRSSGEWWELSYIDNSGAPDTGSPLFAREPG